MSATVFTPEAAKEAKIDIITNGKGTQAVHDAVVAMRANRRSGTASTKTKATVNLSGKKPYRQKGTGRARAGYMSSPIRVGGGVVFGPHPRDYSKKTPKSVKRLAFRKALSTPHHQRRRVHRGYLRRDRAEDQGVRRAVGAAVRGAKRQGAHRRRPVRRDHLQGGPQRPARPTRDGRPGQHRGSAALRQDPHHARRARAGRRAHARAASAKPPLPPRPPYERAFRFDPAPSA